MKDRSASFWIWVIIVSGLLLAIWAILVVASIINGGDFILYLLGVSMVITAYHGIIRLITMGSIHCRGGDNLDIDPVSGKTIVWGQAAFDAKTLKDPDVRITNISVDTEWDMVHITREIGVDVRRINITMEEVRKIGFINLDALGGYLE